MLLPMEATAQPNTFVSTLERAPSGRGALSALSLCVLLPSLATSCANAGLPALAAAFGAPFRHVQWVVLSYLLTMTATVTFAGRLGDALGRRRLLLAGLALFYPALTHS